MARAEAENAETILSHHLGDRRPNGVRALIPQRAVSPGACHQNSQILNVFSHAAGPIAETRLSYQLVPATDGEGHMCATARKVPRGATTLCLAGSAASTEFRNNPEQQ